jgi:hypothetical protein
MSVAYDGDGNPTKPTPLWFKIGLIVVIIVVVVIFFKSRSGNSGGGLLSLGNCSSNSQYQVPKNQFKGVGVTMSAHRCSGDSDETGRVKPYVQALVRVKGTTDDKSLVRNLKTVIHVYRKSTSGKWVRASLTDLPVDTGVQGKGTTDVVYDTDRRWRLPHVPTRVNVALKLTTNKGKPATVRHSFVLP